MADTRRDRMCRGARARLAACGDDDDSSAATTTAGAADDRGGRRTDDRRRSRPTPPRRSDRRPPRRESTDSTEAESSDTTAAAGGGEFGLIDGVYTGADGFVLDPADCPEDWDPKQGITDTEITLFSSMPKAGPLAGFGLIADGIKSYFKYINETNGGIDGRKLYLEVKDDGYPPDKTKTNVDEALGQNKYAGMLTIIGTPNNLAVWDSLNDECMPQLLNGTGRAAVGRHREPPVDDRHAARLLHPRPACGPSG